MSCPVHKRQHSPSPNQRLLTKRTDAEEGVIQQTLTDFRAVLRNWHDSVLDALTAREIPLEELEAATVAVERVLDPYRDAFDVVLETAWQDGHDTGRADAIQRHELDISFDLQRDEVAEALRENAHEASEYIQETMTGDLADALVDANDRGLGIPEITELLREEVYPQMEGYQAERVARTEVVSSSNKGSFEAYRDSSATEKTWLATDDSRTRLSHRRADNQTVGIDEEFTVGGHSCSHPGDMSLPVSERANCRCSLAPAGF